MPAWEGEIGSIYSKVINVVRKMCAYTHIPVTRYHNNQKSFWFPSKCLFLCLSLKQMPKYQNCPLTRNASQNCV